MSTRTLLFLDHLRDNTSPFRLRRVDVVPQWDDAETHAALAAEDHELYALCGLADRVSPTQRARVLYHLLARSRAGLDAETRLTLDRVAAHLLPALDADLVLTVFLALRRARANHKHVSRAILRYVLNHPRLEELAERRRPALADVLEHALGKNVVRACAKLIATYGVDDAYVRRHLLRHAKDTTRAAEVVAFLFGHGECPPVRDGAVSLPTLLTEVEGVERPRTITATNRGDISATLVHLYRGGDNAELRQALDRYVERAALRLPKFDGRVAVVLDASASTRGYGEREFCCVSQSQALRLVLEQCSAEVKVFTVGGGNVNPPRPDGETDLASALLDALETEPDVVAVVTDGYENAGEGDLARVVASLPTAGVTTPVVFCHSKFTARDDLSLRRPALEMPELEFWHEDDFAEVLWSLFARAKAPRGEAFVRDDLKRRLAALEQEGKTWLTN